MSPDFRSHAESYFTVPLFSSHDHGNFEIFCYADVLSPDGITSGSAVAPTSGGASRPCRRASRRVDPPGRDRHPRRSDHAHGEEPSPGVRPQARARAGVLACLSGHHGASDDGLSPHGRDVDPPGLYDRCYAEESLRLPDSFGCYDPLATGPAVNDPPARESGTITFGSFNNFCKVNPEVLRLWARVLKAVHRSRLVMLAPEGVCRRRTVEYLEREGLGPGRVAFVDMQPRPEYLESYRRIDIVLDSSPTTDRPPRSTPLDGCARGDDGARRRRARGTEPRSHSRHAAVDRRTPEQFVSIAAELAGDLPRLGMLRATLRDRLQNRPSWRSPLRQERRGGLSHDVAAVVYDVAALPKPARMSPLACPAVLDRVSTTHCRTNRQRFPRRPQRRHPAPNPLDPAPPYPSRRRSRSDA